MSQRLRRQDVFDLANLMISGNLEFRLGDGWTTDGSDRSDHYVEAQFGPENNKVDLRVIRRGVVYNVELWYGGVKATSFTADFRKDYAFSDLYNLAGFRHSSTQREQTALKRKAVEVVKNVLSDNSQNLGP